MHYISDCGVVLNAKTIALIITFASLAIVLNPAISGIGIPYPLLPGLYFEVWEIPVLVAFLLFGWKVAISAGLINTAFLIAVFPGMSQPYYFTNFFAQVSMIIGIYLATRLISGKIQEDKPVSSRRLVLSSVLLATFFRVVLMWANMFFILYVDPLQVYPTTPAWYIVKIIWPPQAILNIILTLYMVPSSYLIARIVNRNMKIGNKVL